MMNISSYAAHLCSGFNAAPLCVCYVWCTRPENLIRRSRLKVLSRKRIWIIFQFRFKRILFSRIMFHVAFFLGSSRSAGCHRRWMSRRMSPAASVCPALMKRVTSRWNHVPSSRHNNSVSMCAKCHDSEKATCTVWALSHVSAEQMASRTELKHIIPSQEVLSEQKRWKQEGTECLLCLGRDKRHLNTATETLQRRPTIPYSAYCLWECSSDAKHTSLPALTLALRSEPRDVLPVMSSFIFSLHSALCEFSLSSRDCSLSTTQTKIWPPVKLKA